MRWPPAAFELSWTVSASTRSFELSPQTNVALARAASTSLSETSCPTLLNPRGAAVIDELAVAVALQVRDRGAEVNVIRHDRRRAADLDVALVVAAAGRRDVERRVFRDDVARHVLDGARERVLAVKRALRAAQHFDALDVVDVEQGTLRTRDVDVIQIDADAGLEAPQRVVLADAADIGVDRAGGRAPGIHFDVRRVRGDVFERADVLLQQLVGSERGDRDRDVLQALFAPPGRDGDLLDGAGLGARFGSHGRPGHW